MMKGKEGEMTISKEERDSMVKLIELAKGHKDASHFMTNPFIEDFLKKDGGLGAVFDGINAQHVYNDGDVIDSKKQEIDRALINVVMARVKDGPFKNEDDQRVCDIMRCMKQDMPKLLKEAQKHAGKDSKAFGAVDAAMEDVMAKPGGLTMLYRFMFDGPNPFKASLKTHVLQQMLDNTREGSVATQDMAVAEKVEIKAFDYNLTESILMSSFEIEKESPTHPHGG